MSLPRVTSVINPPSGFEMIPEDVLDFASERGTRVHEACAAYALGLWSPVPEDLQGYFDSFRRWFDTYVKEVLAVEPELIHPVFKYVGHADLIARVIGIVAQPTVAIIDVKTPKLGKPEYNMQVSAYVEAAKKDYGAEVGGYLQVCQDGRLPKMTWAEDHNKAFAAFLGGLSMANYKQGGK